MKNAMFVGNFNGRVAHGIVGTILSLGTATTISTFASHAHTETLSDSTQVQAEKTSDRASTNAEKASKAYELGVQHMREGLHTTALTYFQTSQKLEPDPQTTLMMASIESGIGNHTRAWKLLLQTLAERTKLSPERAKSADELANTVQQQLGHLRLTLNRGAIVLVDGHPLEKEPKNSTKGVATRWLAGTASNTQAQLSSVQDYDILVDAGFHRIDVAVDGFYPETRERAVRAGETVQIKVAFTRTFWRKASVGLMIAGGAGVAVGSGLFLAANAEKNAARHECSSAWVCTQAGQKHIGTAKTLADVTTVVIPTSAIVGATGLIYWLATLRVQSSDESQSNTAIFYPSLQVGRHESMVFFSGSF
jgi:hypothetical protein